MPPKRDVCRDPFTAIDQLTDIGVNRILTSGHDATSVEGSELTAKLVEYAADRIILMVCGNLNEQSISRVIAETGAKELHLTGLRSFHIEMEYRNERVFMVGTLRPPEYFRAVTDEEMIRKTISST